MKPATCVDAEPHNGIIDAIAEMYRAPGRMIGPTYARATDATDVIRRPEAGTQNISGAARTS
jgi:hypothetical protein